MPTGCERIAALDAERDGDRPAAWASRTRPRTAPSWRPIRRTTPATRRSWSGWRRRRWPGPSRQHPAGSAGCRAPTARWCRSSPTRSRRRRPPSTSRPPWMARAPAGTTSTPSSLAPGRSIGWPPRPSTRRPRGTTSRSRWSRSCVGLNAFRRLGSRLAGMAYAEGWGLYAERLADEMGLYADDRERFGMLDSEAWRAARLVVDTGIHAFRWTRQQSIELLRGRRPASASSRPRRRPTGTSAGRARRSPT